MQIENYLILFLFISIPFIVLGFFLSIKWFLNVEKTIKEMTKKQQEKRKELEKMKKHFKNQ